jgi:4-diphosphocytidyl-2-C-methyl-D-erythritol kinase
MTSLTVPAYAKINLTLDVLARRPDGYHDIRSIIQTLTLHDTLTITHTPDAPGVRLEVSGVEAGGVPSDASNIVHRAAVRLQKTAAARDILPGSRSGLHIALTKRIPSQAGLGGGSSDAAAALTAIDRLLGLGLSRQRLTEIGAALGADVPFFLTGGTARVEGLGEQITPLPPFGSDLWCLVVKPPVGVSTAAAYAALDADPERMPGRATEEWAATRSPKQRLPLGNDFQQAVLAAYPQIAVAYDAIASGLSHSPIPGGNGPLLSGSGSALFALTANDEVAYWLADYVLGARAGKVWVTRLQDRTE